MPASKKELTFEQALEQLEKLVDAMESGETPLAELIGKFEEGTKLLRMCEKRLGEAELRIEKLKKADGKLEVEPFEEPNSSEEPF